MPGHLVGLAVEPGDLGLDPLRAQRPRRRPATQPGVETRARHLEQAAHPGDAEMALLRVHQRERFSFVSEASWAKKSDAFFQERPIHLQLRVLLAQPGKLGPLGLAPRAVASLMAGPERVHPPTQRRLVDTQLPGHRGHRPTGVDHQLHGLVLVPRSELPTPSSHDETSSLTRCPPSGGKANTRLAARSRRSPSGTSAYQSMRTLSRSPPHQTVSCRLSMTSPRQLPSIPRTGSSPLHPLERPIFQHGGDGARGLRVSGACQGPLSSAQGWS